MSHFAKHEIRGRHQAIRDGWKEKLEHRLADPFIPVHVGERELMQDTELELQLLHESSDDEAERAEIEKTRNDIDEHLRTAMRR